MRTPIVAILATVLMLSIAACQGEAGPAGQSGPAGPPGPAGESIAIDDAMIAAFMEQMAEQSADGLAAVRSEDTERLDNMVHGIISRAENPAFKARLEG